MNLRSKSMLPICIYIYRDLLIYNKINLYIYIYLEIAFKKKHLYKYVYIYKSNYGHICVYMYIQICLHTHMYIYIYISKKIWQSGSTEKYSVEALSAGPSLSRAVVA